MKPDIQSKPQSAELAEKPADSPGKSAPAAGETARQRARKDEILTAARGILIEEGHHRLTMRNVAQRVGIKLASLQYHFPNKADLVTALMDSSDETYQGLVKALLSDVDSSAPDEAVAAMLQAVFEEYQDERSLNFNEQLWALAVRDPQSMELYLKGYQDIWDSAVTMIGRLDPQSTKAERRMRAVLIISLVDGLETFLRPEQLRRQLPGTMKESVSNLIRSIARGDAGQA